MIHLKVEKLSFSYASSPTPIFEQLSVSFSPTWTAVIGANGSGKTTLLKLIAGGLTPDQGVIGPRHLKVYECSQDCDRPPADLEALALAFDPLAISLKGKLGLSERWYEAWDSLSYGERKRLQIAAALYSCPDVLLVDEPSNHLDHTARQRVIELLRGFTGIGIVVSHDRALLDALCSQCLFLDATAPSLLSGCYTAAEAEWSRLRQSEARARSQLLASAEALGREIAHQRHLSAGAKKRLSKRGIDRHDHSAKAKIDGARLTGKDGRSGAKERALGSRRDRLLSDASKIAVTKEYSSGISFSEVACRQKHPVFLSAVTALPLAGGSLSHPELRVDFGHHVGIVGDNGHGKSSFLRHLVASLPATDLLYIPQEVGSQETQALWQKMQALTSEKRGFLLNLVSRLGSRPERLLVSASWSPGELRKILIAMAVVEGKQLMVLDEPTNHMDLASILCLEKALADFCASLVMVSHDQAFLDATCHEIWRVEKDALGHMQLRVP